MCQNAKGICEVLVKDPVIHCYMTPTDIQNPRKLAELDANDNDKCFGETDFA